VAYLSYAIHNAAQPTKAAAEPSRLPDGEPATQPCTIAELDDTRCRWPLADVHQVATMFCGAGTARAFLLRAAQEDRAFLNSGNALALSINNAPGRRRSRRGRRRFRCGSRRSSSVFSS